MTQRIIPNLWFDGVADEAVEFYRQAFGDLDIVQTTQYPTEGLLDFQQPLAGKTLTVQFRIGDVQLLAINADGTFKPNPSMSFILNFNQSQDDEAREHLDHVWDHLVQQGNIIMPLQEYPFTQRYGWVEDRYGFSWQFLLNTRSSTTRQFVQPALTFGGMMQHHARDALSYYTKIFPDCELGARYDYGDQQQGPARPKDIAYAAFTLLHMWFAVHDAPIEPFPAFNESVSFMLECADQAEIDQYWNALSHVPVAEQCGWCKDQFGVSWQIVPDNMDELMKSPDAFPKLLSMGKIDIASFTA